MKNKVNKKLFILGVGILLIILFSIIIYKNLNKPKINEGENNNETSLKSGVLSCSYVTNLFNYNATVTKIVTHDFINDKVSDSYNESTILFSQKEDYDSWYSEYKVKKNQQVIDQLFSFFKFEILNNSDNQTAKTKEKEAKIQFDSENNKAIILKSAEIIDNDVLILEAKEKYEKANYSCSYLEQ